jgi:hypothetical protein
MPFVTRYGGLTTDFDVVKTIKDKDGRIIQKGNGLKTLKLAFGSTCDFNPRSPEFQETVYRGTPIHKQRHWLDTPVFRIPMHRFNLDDQERIYAFFCQNQNETTKVIHYEPSLEDIEVRDVGLKKGWYFPYRILKELIKMGTFERALVETKVELPDEKKLTREEYDMLMQAFAEREEYERSLMAPSKKSSSEKKEEEKVGNVS